MKEDSGTTTPSTNATNASLTRPSRATAQAQPVQAQALGVSTRQAAIDVVNSPNAALNRTLVKAQSIASNALTQDEEAAAQKIADQIVIAARKELGVATDFLLKSLNNGWMLASVKQATIEAGWVDADVVDADAIEV